jgi:SAM-dependent methyltransferase
LHQQDVEICYIDVEKGHDTFMKSRKIARIYYVLAGSGYFTIDNHRYDVYPGVLVEVPQKVEYSYSGKMTLILIARPRWFRGNDTHTKWNPDVVHGSVPFEPERLWMMRLIRFSLFGKSPISAYLRLNQTLWNHLAPSLTTVAPIRLYGNFLHRLGQLHRGRAQAFSTVFLRNRAELELIGRLLEAKSSGATVRVAVLGCSTGAQAYSVAWRIRSARPDLKVLLNAMDISKEAVEIGKRGVYSSTEQQLTNTSITERMTAAEIQEFFDRNAELMTVKPRLREGITWHVGDAGEPQMFDVLGSHDIVVANNFLCHMNPFEAEMCLRNIARLVSPSGYLFVSGVDLDVRTKVARHLGWKPIQELLEEIHEGDPSLRRDWPCHYAGLEPLDKQRSDWRIRYAAVFQTPAANQSMDATEVAMAK